MKPYSLPLRFGLLLCAGLAAAQSYQPTKCMPPPNDAYFQKRGVHAYPGFTYRLEGEHAQFSGCQGLPPSGGTQDHQFDSKTSLNIGGNCVSAPAHCRVRVSHTNDTGCTEHYSTEMLQLDATGGEFPPGMMIRQSPTQRSLGQLSVQPAEGGGYLMDSSFDLWTELSLDGGITWSPATNSVEMALTNSSPRLVSTNNRLPALDSRYSSPAGSLVSYCTNGTNGILISDIVQSAFSTNDPPPPLSGSAMHGFDLLVDFKLSLDGGVSFSQHHAPAHASVLVSHTKDLEGTAFFEDEMLQLDIQGGTLPVGLKIRENPARASLGRSYIRNATGGFMLSSYFDVQTELSTDNGATWNASCCPLRLALEVLPPYPPAVLSFNPLAYFRLNETTQPPPQLKATNLGALGTPGNGTYFGGSPGVSGALAGSPDTAARFNGAVFVPFTQPLSLNAPFTVEAWLKPAATTTGTPCPLSCGTFAGNYSGWLIFQNGGSGWNLQMYNGIGTNTSVNLNATAPVVVGKWVHLAAVFNGATASLFVNGVGTITNVAPPFAANMNGPLTIGMRNDGTLPWPGSVDEVAIYKTLLSPGEIVTHYSNGTNNSPPIPYHQLVLARNPLIYLRLDEPALPMALNSGLLGAAADGTYETFTLPGAPGVPFGGLGAGNYGCQFTGASGYLDVPGASLDLLGPVTLVAWVKAEPNNGIFQTIVGKGDTSYQLDIDWNGYPRFADGDANPPVVGTVTIADGQWHFLAGVYDGFGSNSLYLDGLLNSTMPAPNPIPGNSSDVWIGGAPDYGLSRMLHGVVDEVAIFPNPLGLVQIQHIYWASFHVGGAQAQPAQFGLSIQPINGQALVVWCAGTLQAADDPAGPFVDLAGVTSPYLFNPILARKFYRVRQ